MPDPKPEPEAEPMPKPQPSSGAIVKSKNILFAFDKSGLSSNGRMGLKEILDALNKNSNTRIEINGHTDSLGPEDYNKILSVRRANAVASYLNSKGISKDRMIINGFGESMPLVNNLNDAGNPDYSNMATNRRVEIKIYK